MFKSHIMVLMLLLLFLVPAFTFQSRALGMPTVAVAMDQSEQTVEITSETGGVATFTGVVNCTEPIEDQFQTVVVDMNATAGDGWITTVSPQAINFTSAVTSVNITVVVNVPPTAPYPSSSLTVGGMYHMVPGIVSGTIAPATSMISVNQYFGVDLSSTGTSDVYTGTSFNGSVVLANTGNGQDNFTLSLPNRGEFIGWELSFKAGNHWVLGPFESTTVVLTGVVPANTPTNAPLEIKVKAVSDGAGDNGQVVSDTVSLMVQVHVSGSPPPPDGTDGSDGGSGHNDTSSPTEPQPEPTFHLVGFLPALLLWGLLPLVLPGRKRR